jgi:hypothetical protein
MRLPGKVAPWRHMVEPQSPLHYSQDTAFKRESLQYIPEVGGDRVATIRLHRVLLRSALGDLEAVLAEDGVAGVRAATDLAAVLTVAEDLAAS